MIQTCVFITCYSGANSKLLISVTCDGHSESTADLLQVAQKIILTCVLLLSLQTFDIGNMRRPQWEHSRPVTECAEDNSHMCSLLFSVVPTQNSWYRWHVMVIVRAQQTCYRWRRRCRRHSGNKSFPQNYWGLKTMRRQPKRYHLQ